MKPITMYEANDGSRHITQEAAEKRDRLIEDVARAMVPLGDRPDDDGCRFSNGHGYKQHSPDAVLTTKAALIELTEHIIPWWFKDQRAKHGTDFMQVHPSWFGRMLDGSAPPLEGAWQRLYCIDLLNREWGQPFYAMHPEQAPKQTEVSGGAA